MAYTDAYLHIFEEKVSKLHNKIRELESEPTPNFEKIQMYTEEANSIENNIMIVREAMKEARAA